MHGDLLSVRSGLVTKAREETTVAFSYVVMLTYFAWNVFRPESRENEGGTNDSWKRQTVAKNTRRSVGQKRWVDWSGHVGPGMQDPANVPHAVIKVFH